MVGSMPAAVPLPLLTEPAGGTGGGGCATEEQPSHVHAADAPSGGGGASGGPSVYLETFGCQMNVLDSQLVTSQLRGLGYRFTDDWKSADIVLYNTCSIREQAENKVYSRIGHVGRHKRDRPDVVLGVIGCMAERDGRDLVRRHPQVDVLVGPAELDKVPLLLDNAQKAAVGRDAGQLGGLREAGVALQGYGQATRRSATLDAAGDPGDRLELIDLSRSFEPADVATAFAGGVIDAEAAVNRSAYVRITRGCNKRCTYCVVPQTRGPEVHRPPDHIVQECRRLADAGVIEVTLLGQTVNHYHFDHGAATTVAGLTQPQVGEHLSPNRGTGGPSPRFGKAVTSFADLLHRIHDEVPAIQRLRFVTSFPRDFGDDILQVIRDSPRICRYLHLPVQSGSDRVLARMNRGYRIAQYRDLVDRARAQLPGVELATDIITGFPGETDADHAATLQLLREVQFKNAFIFKYSPRPGTAAMDRLPDDVPEDIKRRRNAQLLAAQADASKAVHQRYVGRTVDVFVERVSTKGESDAGTTQLSGRTDSDLIVLLDGDASLIGQVVSVRVTSAATLALFGEPV
jgi:tRNA-2-methylthio-N6-dimethylallyladenosine synthase